MALDADPPGLSRRETRFRRTRADLVAAAVRLYLERGYDRTTIDLIAAEAGVSSRTLTRYFGTKQAVFLAALDPVTEQLMEAVREQPDDRGPLETLRAAHIAVFTRVADDPDGEPSAAAVTVMLRVVNSPNTLSNKEMQRRNERMRMILAARTGPPLDERTIDLVATLFSITLVSAFEGLVADTDDRLLGPRLMVQRLNEAFADLAGFVADLPGADSRIDG